MMRVAEHWYERRTLSDGITLLWEPHVHDGMRCNIWHVRGRDRDVVVDPGFGVKSLRAEAADLFGHELLAVATHYHFDHAGGLHEFEHRLAHASESEWLAEPPAMGALLREQFAPESLAYLEAVGYPVPACLLSALPVAGYDPASWRQLPAAPTRTVDEGDVVDLGDRRLEVLHLPGHTPGCIGLWEAATGALFSGDAVYDATLLDELPESDKAQYANTMRRLLEVPVSVVHAGHYASFGRERLRQLAGEWLAALERQ